MNEQEAQLAGSLEPMVSRRSNDEWLKAQCNRYANGQCSTLACLKRGGYVRGMPPDYTAATCEPHEILTELVALRMAKVPTRHHPA